MSLKNRLLLKQQEKNAPWNTIELDYALSWILAALGEHPTAKSALVFKGGTCLKKCYFGENYRFSEDLDFTVDPSVTDLYLDQVVADLIQSATELSARLGSGLEFSSEIYEEKAAHPFNQRAYVIRAKFPWHRSPLTKIKVEMSRDESLAFPVQQRAILHEYGEVLPQTVTAYALEEILAEKYRGILQNQERLRVKGWVRSRVRDFYDLWHILKRFKTEINFSGFREAFIMKCRLKNIVFDDPTQFFNQADYLARVERDWQQYLKDLINDLPQFSDTVAELEILTTEVFRD